MRLKGDLGKDKVGKLLVILSLPAMIGMTVQALYNVVDTFWVGKIGADAIAALTICFPIQMLMIAIASGTGIGLSSIISRRLGEDRKDQAINAAEHGIVLILFYGVIITLFGLYFVRPLLIIFGATPELLLLSEDYITLILLGSIFLFFAVMSGSIIQAQGNSGIPMKSMLTGAITNIILDPFLIFGLGPFPEMGVQGAALATVIAQIAACTINFRFLFSQDNLLTLTLKNFEINFSIIWEIYKVGLPSIIMQLMHSVIIVILNWILGTYSYLAIAAMGIFFRIQSIIFMPVMGLTSGLIPIIAYAYGAKNLPRLKRALILAAWVSFALMSIGFLAFQLIPEQLIRIFNNDPELVRLGVECMRNISLLLPFVGPAIIASSLFQAVGKGLTAMWLSLLRQVVLLVPALMILPHYFDLRGVWLSFPASDFFTIVITSYVLFTYLKNLERNGFPSKKIKSEK